MATNKERIEHLEAGFERMQDGFERIQEAISRLEHGKSETNSDSNERLFRLEESINRLTNLQFSKQETQSQGAVEQSGKSSSTRLLEEKEETRVSSEEGRQLFHSRLARLDFPRYGGDDPTEWLNKVEQFFDYQAIDDNQKVSLAAFHLEGEANQWWQWLKRAFREDDKDVTWVEFVEELWARFGPTDYEDFDEALSKIQQGGSLRDYQKEFERLGNRVQGWSQKALVGSFMGGLKSEIAEGIRMFKPRTLKEAISFARMRDQQLIRQKGVVDPSTKVPITSAMKRMTWEDMQQKRVQGLCFHCDERFTPGHKCKGAQLLLLDGTSGDGG